MRINAGYTIISSIPVTQYKEILLGCNNSGNYVTWEYSNKNNSYDFGHYYSDKLSAMTDYTKRIQTEIKYQSEIREQKRRHTDIDADGIPDFIDAQYTTEDDKYIYQIMDKEQLSKLDNYVIEYEALEKDTDCFIVKYTYQYKTTIEDLLNDTTATFTQSL